MQQYRCVVIGMACLFCLSCESVFGESRDYAGTSESAIDGVWQQFLTRGPYLTARLSPTLQPGETGQMVSLNGGGSSDGPNEPASWSWDFVQYASPTEPALTVSPNQKLAYFTPSVDGVYVVSLVVGDGAGNYDEARATVVVGGLPDVIWVDFAAEGAPESADGTPALPFKELWRAEDQVTPNGVISILAGQTSETPTLGGAGEGGKAYQMVAVGGTVRIGVTQARQASTRAADLKPRPALPLFELARLFAGVTAKPAVQAPIAYDSAIYEAVLPFRQTADGMRAVQADSPLSIRLRGAVDFDAASQWASLTGCSAHETIALWQPVSKGNLCDIWITIRPVTTWHFDDTFELSGGGTTVKGELVAAEAFGFKVESEAEYIARTTAPVNIISPPADGEEANEAVLSELNNDSIPTLPNALGSMYNIGPEQAFETPQRVWMPIPPGASTDRVQLYYYHANGEDYGWYPAEKVEGWLLPDSYLHLRQDGETWLGFLVNHAGIVQLGSTQP